MSGAPDKYRLKESYEVARRRILFGVVQSASVWFTILLKSSAKAFAGAIYPIGGTDFLTRTLLFRFQAVNFPSAFDQPLLERL